MTIPTRNNGSVIDSSWFNSIKSEVENNTLTVTAATTTYPIVSGDKLITGDATAGAFDVTLPAISGNEGKNYIVKKIDASANAVTLEGNGAETIDGALNEALAGQYDNIWVVAGASEWHMVAKWNDIQDVDTGATPSFAGITNDSADIEVSTTTSGNVNLTSAANIVVLNKDDDTSATTQTVKFGDDTGGVTGFRNSSGTMQFQNAGGGWSAIGGGSSGGYTQATLLSNTGLSIVMAANAVTIALKQADGSSDPSIGGPVEIGMRSSTITTGAYNLRSVTGALSTVISSGSTAGTASATENKIYIYLIDNTGTLELAWSRTLFSNENELITTVAEGGAGAADNNGTMYSTTQRTDLPFRLIGSFTSTQATAGTWATNASEVFIGNQQSMSEEKVSLWAQHSAVTATGVVAFPFNTVTQDTHNGYNVSTGEYTISRDDYYDIQANLETGSGANTMRIHKTPLSTGVRITLVERYNASTFDKVITASGVYLKKGDIIDISLPSETTQAVLAANHFFVSSCR